VTGTPSFEVIRLPFELHELQRWSRADGRHANWPVVYLLDEGRATTGGRNLVYVGETTNARKRLEQHLANEAKQDLTSVRVVVDGTFNKSVCHDLESHLIQLLAGDPTAHVLNRNDGIVDRDYYQREQYRALFREIFDRLHDEGLFSRTVAEIFNSDLFKLSPFKALNTDQAAVVEDIVEGLLSDLTAKAASTIVVQGGPGTGKTIVGIYLMKLLSDVAHMVEGDEPETDSAFAEFFLTDTRELLRNRRIALVVPQQSLRTSIKRVFKSTPGLSADMVLTPFEVGEAEARFDLLIVDEAHRLSQRAPQAHPTLTKKFAAITERLFGEDDEQISQLDWIVERSDHQILLLDSGQSVRPADIGEQELQRVASAPRSRSYRLASQMRVRADGDYVALVRQLMTSPAPDESTPLDTAALGDYDLQLFDDLGQMRSAIRAKEAQFQLARMVAGYAWPWRSRKDPTAFDIVLDGISLQWNRTDKDWINSPTSLQEVGCVHTVQGYDLNYAGVIIGRDLWYDAATGQIQVDPTQYHDKRGKMNVKRLGPDYTADNLPRFIANAYRVLLTRGILGTYIYVCDPGLRELFHRRLGRPRVAAGTRSPGR
jgi:DUF2075 family protein